MVRRSLLPFALALPTASAVAIASRGASPDAHIAPRTHFIDVEVAQPPVRVRGVGLFMDGVGMYVDGVGMIMDPVRATIEETAGKWAALADQLAASTAPAAALEAARKLIANHEAVLRDMTNTVPSATQPDLGRLGMFEALFIDQALREVARRLLGRPDPEEQLDPTVLGQARTWARTAAYLDRRLQATSNECPGRAPDMSVTAAAAMRAALHEVASTAQGVA